MKRLSSSSRIELPHLSALGIAVLFVLLLSGSLHSEGADLAPYPFTKSQFDGKVGLVAAQNGATSVIAARTFVITEELKNHLGQFQIDLMATLRRTGNTPPLDTVYADRILTSSFYVSSSVSNYYAMPPTPQNGELFDIHTSAFVDSFGTPLQTYAVPGGNQFVATVDLGISFNGSVNLAFSTLTSESQTLALRTWISGLEVGDVAVIGISFDAVSEDGITEITTTTDDLGHDVVAFGTTLPPLSLGFFVTPVSEVSVFPKVSCALTSTAAQLTFSDLIPTREYRIMRAPTLAAWVEAHRFTATATTDSWGEPLATGGKMFYRLEWSE